MNNRIPLSLSEIFTLAAEAGCHDRIIRAILAGKPSPGLRRAFKRERAEAIMRSKGLLPRGKP